MTHKLLKSIAELVPGQRFSVEVDDDGRYIFRLETIFTRESKPFWIITPQDMINIKYHFEKGDLDDYLANVLDSLIEDMDEAVLHNEPELYYPE